MIEPVRALCAFCHEEFDILQMSRLDGDYICDICDAFGIGDDDYDNEEEKNHD